jgi:hypothetical protein
MMGEAEDNDPLRIIVRPGVKDNGAEWMDVVTLSNAMLPR